MRHWLLKSEPESYSIDDLRRDCRAPWTGVRNYQARNLMRDEMKVGDLAIFYHSNAEPSGAVGVCKIVGAAHADESALDKKSEYFEKRATREKPVWMCVDVGFEEKFARVVSLAELRENPRLKDLPLLRKGNRLSVQPMSAAEFKEICRMSKRKP